MKKLFLLTFLVALAGFVIMAIFSIDFQLIDGHYFTIMDLEMPGSKENLIALYAQMTPQVLTSVKKNLYADFLFMMGCYPFVALVCLAAARKSQGFWQRIFSTLAILQIFPFVFDVIENISLLKWIDDSAYLMNFLVFQSIVWVKFILAVGAFLLSLIFLLYTAVKKMLYRTEIKI